MSHYTDQMKAFDARRKWITAAWLLGASYKQLAELHGVKAPTMVVAVDKEMRKQERREARRDWKLSQAALLQMYALWKEHSTEWSELTITEIADHLAKY